MLIGRPEAHPDFGVSQGWLPGPVGCVPVTPVISE